MTHVVGTRIDIHTPAMGLGTVIDITGGPDGPQYRVQLDQPTDDGLPWLLVVRAGDFILADPLPSYSIGDRVTYFGRSAIVTDVGLDGRIYILCERDPPELWHGIEHEYSFILYPWQLHVRFV